MGKIAGKVPKMQEKLFDFPYFRQKFDRLFLSPYRLRKKTSKKKEQSATVPKDVYCYRYCFLETKECMHNEVGTYAEILPQRLLTFECVKKWNKETLRSATSIGSLSVNDYRRHQQYLHLRTLARNFFNIDFFLKLLPL